jgi:hypothetical protein
MGNGRAVERGFEEKSMGGDCEGEDEWSGDWRKESALQKK